MSTINPLRVQRKKMLKRKRYDYVLIHTPQKTQRIYFYYLFLCFIHQIFHFFLFGRYSPMAYPTVMKFSVDGVTLMEHMYNCNKVSCTIYLDNLGQKSSGSYRCEISGDAPEFNLKWNSRNMTIAGQLVNIFMG